MEDGERKLYGKKFFIRVIYNLYKFSKVREVNKVMYLFVYFGGVLRDNI